MMLHSGELPLCGAARSKEEAASWGSSTAVLPRSCWDGGGRRLLLVGAPAARGCSIEGEKRLLRLGDLLLRGAARFEGRKRLHSLGELPLRGAAGMGEGG